MKFNTPEFLLFFVVVALASRWASARVRIWGLLLASLFFYAWWSVPFLGLLLFSVVLDFGVGLALGTEESPRKRSLLLAVSMVGNLGVLFAFKYLDLFLATWHGLATGFSGEGTPTAFHLILPLGISFYTFQSMSYTIDVYRRRLEPCRDLPVFALYVTFFPQLVAGPIVRASDLIPQLQVGPVHDEGRFRAGFPLMAWGFVKKMVIADRAAPFADAVFSDPHAYGGLQVLLGVYAFAIQIYCDFSGYTDIAIGCARVLGFHFPENFRTPYLAHSIRDFWRRWHISLSTWLRDYLYIPLGGNRGGKGARDRNLLLTMLLGGLWHGAAWHFVAWGGFHGILLGVDRRIEGFWGRLTATLPGRILAVLTTFHLVCIGWVLFRADDLGVAWTILTRVFAPAESTAFGRQILLLAAAFVVITWVERTRPLDTVFKDRPFAAAVATWAGGTLAVVLGAPSTVPFIYFQF